MSLQLSVLDYVSIDEGSDATTAITEMDRLADTAEELGYEHYWVAEHHGYDSSASVAPEVLMARLASRTTRLKIGSGGVMLPNYSAYKVAESFKTMQAFAPGRIDLGVGRSTGADQIVTGALNDEKRGMLPYERKVRDMLGFLGADHPDQSQYTGLQARPLTAAPPTPWVLGSSGNTAALAAREGIGFTFAHFINAGQRGPEAVAKYRDEFQPSVFLSEPQALVGVFVSVAETREKAELLGKALHLWLLWGETKDPNASLPTLEETERTVLTPQEQQIMDRNQGRVLVGTGPEVVAELRQLSSAYGTDKLMVNPYVPGVENRVRALELLAQAAHEEGQ